MTFPHLTPTELTLAAGWAGKIFIELADSMPPPPDGCKFWCRWFYDFIQHLASNGARIGAVRK